MLSEPQTHRLIHQIGHIQGPIPGTIHTAKILTQIPKTVTIMAVIVLQIAGLEVQGGQILQFLIPDHGGHASRRIITWQRTRGYVVPSLIMFIQDKGAIGLHVHHGGIWRASLMEVLRFKN